MVRCESCKRWTPIDRTTTLGGVLLGWHDDDGGPWVKVDDEWTCEPCSTEANKQVIG